MDLGPYTPFSLFCRPPTRARVMAVQGRTRSDFSHLPPLRRQRSWLLITANQKRRMVELAGHPLAVTASINTDVTLSMYRQLIGRKSGRGVTKAASYIARCSRRASRQGRKPTTEVRTLALVNLMLYCRIGQLAVRVGYHIICC